MVKLHLDPTEIARWKQAGFESEAVIEEWFKLFEDPVEAYQWYRLGVSPVDAYELEENFITAKDYMYIRKFFTHDEIMKYAFHDAVVQMGIGFGELKRIFDNAAMAKLKPEDVLNTFSQFIKKFGVEQADFIKEMVQYGIDFELLNDIVKKNRLTLDELQFLIDILGLDLVVKLYDDGRVNLSHVAKQLANAGMKKIMSIRDKLERLVAGEPVVLPSPYYKWKWDPKLGKYVKGKIKEE
jgi:hypothetical protein